MNKADETEFEFTIKPGVSLKIVTSKVGASAVVYHFRTTTKILTLRLRNNLKNREKIDHVLRALTVLDSALELPPEMKRYGFKRLIHEARDKFEEDSK